MPSDQGLRDRVRDILLAAGIIWLAVNVPWQLEFGTHARMTAKVVDHLVTLLFGADLWLRWRSHWSRPTAANVTAPNRRESVWWLLVDVPAAIPFPLLGGPIWLLVMRLTKVPRLVQMMRQWRRRDIHNASLLRLVFFVFWMLLIAHWIACGWASLRDREVVAGVIDNDSMHYLRALYWTITTLATVGYGDITPDSPSQMMYAIMTMLFGVGLFGYGIGNVAHMLANIDQVQAHYHSSLDRLANFLRYRKIPAGLQRRIYNYYTFLWERHLGYDEAIILSELPEPLRIEIAVAMKREFIEKVPLFRGASPQLLREIAVELRAALFTPGDYVFRAGEIGRHMYFISSGAVEVVAADGQTILSTLTDGDFFGEIALLAQRPRTASIRAIDFCDMYSLDKESFERVLAYFPEFAAQVREESDRRLQALPS
ncbi:MAG: cyclic nucleotide-binding domain-containing protein [Planctomycetaceae bacterium]